MKFNFIENRGRVCVPKFSSYVYIGNCIFNGQAVIRIIPTAQVIFSSEVIHICSDSTIHCNS